MGVKFGFKLNNSMVVGPDNGGASDLADLGDVDLTTPTDGQVLKYNSTSGKWENDDVSGGSSSLAELNDVAISSPSDRQGLVYDAQSGNWINGDSSGFALDKVATGSVVSFNDGADDLPVLGLTAQIVPFQDGTGDPSPSNVRPISGFTGVNVKRFEKNMMVAPTLTTNTDSLCLDLGVDKDFDAITFSFLATNSTVGSISSAIVDLQESNGTHHYKTLNDFKNSNNVSFSANANNGIYKCTYQNIKFRYVYVSYCTARRSKFTSDSLSNWQMEVGSTATDYEAPTTPTTYSVTWQTEAGTVYFGYIDLTTGVLTVTHGLAQVTGASIHGTINNSYYVLATPKPSGLTNKNLPPVGASDKYKYVSTYAERVNGTCYIITNQVAFVDDRFTSLAEAQRILDEEKPWICYELATPQTYQLTPTEVKTLLGNNTIVADTGNVSVDYQTEQASDIIDLVGEGGASDLADLGDVALTTPTDGQVLKYNSIYRKWKNVPDTLVVTITAANETLTADKTFAEIRAALKANRRVLMNFSRDDETYSENIPVDNLYNVPLAFSHELEGAYPSHAFTVTVLGDGEITVVSFLIFYDNGVTVSYETVTNC